jgi:protein SCO1/2
MTMAGKLFRRMCAACALAAAALVGHAADRHAAHAHEAEQTPGYARRLATYRLPEAVLVRSDGAKVSFTKEIEDGRPVVLNFIYTTCTAVCPILSHSFAGFQRGLGAERDKVRMVSISIDPEQDTPERLAEYARRFDAGRQWGFYTGSNQASVTVQKAFQAYFGDKMHHRPMTFMRVAPGEPWVRLEGFATPDELLAEYRRQVAAR